LSDADPVDPHAFYTRKIPGDFNRMLDQQAARAEEGRRVYEDMVAVNGSIRVDVCGDDAATFFLNIEAGWMTPGDSPSHAPFLTLVQEMGAFRRLAREADESLTALLGALAGLSGDMKLTRKRMLDMEAVKGLIRLEVTGEDGFSILTQFGTGPLPDEPDATIRVGEETYRELHAGRLDPQSAFLDDKIHAEGDMQKVMQLAFAAVAPD
jgi:putative sterol carrier protein